MKILSLFSTTDSLVNIKKYTDSLSLCVDSFNKMSDALQSAQDTKYDVAVVEHTDNELDALEFVRAFRHMYRETPIIVLSLADAISLQEKAIKIGAYGTLTKPVSPILLQAQLEHALRLTKAESLLKDETLMLQNEVKNATQELKESEHELLDILGKSCEYKEHGSSEHAVRVAHYTKIVAKAAGLNEKIQDIAFHASRIYDIGKVTISDALLLKKEKLEPDELELIKTHARKGYDLLKYAKGAYLKAGAVISYSHHEKYDGSGYPIGLKGETIPILGRIVAIADVFEALTSKKPYRDAWSIEDACKYLVEEKGKHFDPVFVDVFMDNIEEIKSLKVL